MAFVAIFLLLVSTTVAVNSSPIVGEDTEQTANFVYGQPDLVTTVETSDGGEILLEAYKSTHNDEVLIIVREGQTASPQSNFDTDIGKLVWVSAGHPTFVATPDQSTGEVQLFHVTASGIHTYVQMLTVDQRYRLAAAANDKYRGLDVGEQQIADLILSRFECSVNYNQEYERESHVLRGIVTDFTTFPLRMDFEAPLGSVQRDFALKLANEWREADLQFACQMASRDKTTRSNTLTIGVRQLEEIGLVDMLFKPRLETMLVASSDTIYVTRRQLSQLANDMYWTLNIMDDYRMPQEQFVEAFVDDLAAQTAVFDFAMVPADVISDQLSAYGFDSSPDFRTDQTVDSLKWILRIDSRDDGAWRRIVVDETKYDELQHLGRGDNIARLLGVEAAVEWARKNAARAWTDAESIGDQLTELNDASATEVQWSLDVDDRIAPKALRLARLDRSRFYRTLTFERVHLKISDAAFEQQFSMYTSRTSVYPHETSDPSTERWRETSTDTVGYDLRTPQQAGPVVPSTGFATSEMERQTMAQPTENRQGDDVLFVDDSGK
jgi:hypothetical protein